LFNVGYGLVAASYTLLLLMLFAVRNAGMAKNLLSFATLTIILWALTHLGYLKLELGQENLLIYDSIRQWVWMLFIAACLRNHFDGFLTFVTRPITLAIMVLPTLTFITAALDVIPSTWQFSLHTVLALQALVMLEVVYRQADDQKWAFKPLILYLGALSLFDFVTYANATMVDQLNWAFFAARGYVYVALLPLLVLAIRRIKHWGIDIFVSREVVLHSTLLMVAGVYLLVMAMFGYIVQFFGGSWGLPVQLVLVAVSLVLLMSLFMSHQFRNSLKIFITKHFYANQYDYRVEWVKLTKRLSQSGDSLEEVYQTALSAYLEGVGYSQGCLVKSNGNALSIVARSSGDAKIKEDEFIASLPSIVDFCEQKHWVIDFNELQVKPDLYDTLKNRNDFMAGFVYQLAVPIYQNDQLWGLVFMRALAPDTKSLNWELRDYINALTDQIANFIFNAESSNALAENAQFAAFNRMSAFVVHDLKNVLAQINLILSNAEQHRDNPEFIDDTFETLHHTQQRMDKMLKQLTNKKVEAKQSNVRVDIVALVDELIHNKCRANRPLPTLSANGAIEVKIDAEKFSNVMYHLIHNAQQATADDGMVTVSMTEDGHYISISISDDGVGMSEAFIKHRLFKPFDTTKGNAGMGIGAYDARQFVQESGGNIEVNSIESQGTEFIVRLPLAREE
jgi:putative PEP-CTERM system histidine kinase